jgi:hypothetical protein
MERTIDKLDDHITEAFQALKGARVIADRNPSSVNLQTVQEMQDDLDYLLDVKFEYTPIGSENTHG